MMVRGMNQKSLPGQAKIGLERGGRGCEPVAQVSQTDLCLSRLKTAD